MSLRRHTFILENPVRGHWRTSKTLGGLYKPDREEPKERSLTKSGSVLKCGEVYETP